MGANSLICPFAKHVPRSQPATGGRAPPALPAPAIFKTGLSLYSWRFLHNLQSAEPSPSSTSLSPAEKREASAAGEQRGKQRKTAMSRAEQSPGEDPWPKERSPGHLTTIGKELTMQHREYCTTCNPYFTWAIGLTAAKAQFRAAWGLLRFVPGQRRPSAYPRIQSHLFSSPLLLCCPKTGSPAKQPVSVTL